MAWGVPFSFTVDPVNDQWFILSVPSGGTFGCHFGFVDSPYPVALYDGLDCASLLTEFSGTVNSPGHDTNVTVGPPKNIYVQILSFGAGNIHGTFQAGP